MSVPGRRVRDCYTPYRPDRLPDERRAEQSSSRFYPPASMIPKPGMREIRGWPLLIYLLHFNSGSGE